jgi:hypothetical protein
MKQITFNFKDRFAAAVERGAKTSTIRIFLKTTPPKKGDRLKHFTGMRTKRCRRLLQPICQECLRIQITKNKIVLGKQRLTVAEENQLARNDGFHNAAELRTFFRSTYGFPLPGKPHWVSWH